MEFWPPQQLKDFAILIPVILVGLIAAYQLWQLIMYGLFKSYFEARRGYYKKMKEDIVKWQKRDK